MTDWQQFALVLIDVQKDSWDEEHEQKFPEFKKKTQVLLKTCRSQNLSVIHLRAQFQTDKSDWMAIYKLSGKTPFVMGTEGERVMECAEALSNEKIIYKHSYDGFINSELESFLKTNNKKFLLIAGLYTSVCVKLTAISAAQRGFLVSVINDCVADLHQHKESLEWLGKYISDLVSMEEIVSHNPKWADQIDQLARV